MESEIKELMRIIDKSDLNSLFAYEEIFATFLYLNRFSFPSSLLKSKSVFCRTRNNKNKLFTEFSELSCPDSSLVHNYSRANKPHQSVFYLSDKYETNRSELLPTWSCDAPINFKFDITISVWELNEDIFVALIPEKSNPAFHDYFKKNFSKIEIEFLNWITEKFSTKILENPNVYKFTSALCNVLLDRETKQKNWGTLYPSVHSRDEIGKGYNIALIPEALKLFTIKEVYKQKIIKIGEEKWEDLGTPIKAKLDYNSQKIIWEE
jgi:hypothetical protein